MRSHAKSCLFCSGAPRVASRCHSGWMLHRKPATAGVAEVCFGGGSFDKASRATCSLHAFPEPAGLCKKKKIRQTDNPERASVGICWYVSAFLACFGTVWYVCGIFCYFCGLLLISRVLNFVLCVL